MPKLTNIDIPQAFLCAFSGRLMTEPVKAADGYIYEHEVIQDWLKSKKTSPITGEPLSNFYFIGMPELRNQIQNFINTHHICSYAQFFEAMRYGNMQKLSELNFLGSYLNAELTQGWTPLLIAAYNGYIDLTKYLINAGVRIDACNAQGWNALHLAAYRGHIEIVKLLLDTRIELIFVMVNGTNAENIATRTGHDAVRHLLKEAMAEHTGQSFKKPQPINKTPTIEQPLTTHSKWTAIAEKRLPEASIIYFNTNSLVKDSVYKTTADNAQEQTTKQKPNLNNCQADDYDNEEETNSDALSPRELQRRNSVNQHS